MKQLQQNGRDLSQRLVIWRNNEKIQADREFLEQIVPAANRLCEAIREYPLDIALQGSFESVWASIKKEIPTNSRPAGKFDTGQYAPRWDGTPVYAYGHWLLIEFEKKQKEKLYEQTGGKISDAITLERDAFIQAVKPKPGRPVMEAAHDVAAIQYENPESAQRCNKLLTFVDGKLTLPKDWERKVEGAHSILATTQQMEVYEATRHHIEALRSLRAPDAFAMAIKSDDETNLLWLNLAGHVVIRE